ncbi:tRNA 2-selenouridine(34) synthase MnmH [Ferrimonas marina]|uniref:tRNA 2-selenouridine synthase n=1 Tax=Ferrimonas marina TaxID=299255 RepID=A0A1M5Z9K2_9GAMM|nr:tRNA 2-selenouridine(34) synthase MnmH [Ferrimonas marina]SHI20563.1 tRNA 2-selenouridine synthase [Ferrimonas marina]
MTDRIPATEYDALLLSDTPMIDLRAPVEFAKGAFPGSVSLPLMTDQERAAVGTCYKQQGQQAAIALGHQLVSGAVKQARIDAWLEQIQQRPDTVLYCFRGGMRSEITQSWLAQAGVHRPYVIGGYKALRGHLIARTEQRAEQAEVLVLAGMTGSGKTDFLLKRPEAVDLEGLANHRGSSFGRRLTPQPAQIDFENRLALALMRHQRDQRGALLLEDESRLIGRASLPLTLFNRMSQAPRIVLEVDQTARVEQILKDYVINLRAEYLARDGEEVGHIGFAEQLSSSLARVRKRLGGQLYQKLDQLLSTGLEQQQRDGDLCAHREWIAILLSEYYDPMYHYQMAKQESEVLFRGTPTAVAEYLDQRS